jgi:hypothetical protein
MRTYRRPAVHKKFCGSGCWSAEPLELTPGKLRVRGAPRGRCRATGSELGRQAVEEGLEAEPETVVGCRRVVGGGRFEAGSQPRELRRNLSGLGQAVADLFLGIAALAAELPGERGSRGGAQSVAEHEGEHGGHSLVGPFDFGLLPGDTDEYIITGGAFQGQRGFFSRDDTGAVVGVDLAGRLFRRVRAAG